MKYQAIIVIILFNFNLYSSSFDIKKANALISYWKTQPLSPDVKEEIIYLEGLINEYYPSSYKEELSIQEEILELIKLEVMIIETLIEINKLKKELKELERSNLSLFQEKEIIKGEVEDLMIRYRGISGEKDY